MFEIVTVVEPAVLPITTAELKDYLRVDGSGEDSRIDLMCGAATRLVEEHLGIRIITQTVDIFMPRFPMKNSNLWWDGVREVPVSFAVTQERNITLPIGNVTSFVHFKTFDDSQEYAENLANYTINTSGQLCQIGLKLSGYWPVTILRSSNAVNFRVIAGWANAAAVPADVKQAITEIVSHMYENRGDQTKMAIPAHIFNIVGHRKRVKLA